MKKGLGFDQRRRISSESTLIQPLVAQQKPKLPPLSVMPTGILIRGLMMTYILSSPRLVGVAIPIMNRVSHSKLWFLNPDKNPILHLGVRKLFYDHFCAGENEHEVKSTIKAIKEMGFEGVILGYAKETLSGEREDTEESPDSRTRTTENTVQEWKNGTLKTLRMLGKGDFLAVK